MEQRTYSLRKLKFGLTSIAIAFFMIGGITASADTVTQTDTAITAQTTTGSPTEKALSEIDTTLNQPTVADSDAKAGDVVDVTATASTPTINETPTATGSVTTVEGDITITTKSVATQDDLASAPTTTEEQASHTQETATEKITTEERVIKTRTVELVTETSAKSEEEPVNTDIVFVVDHTDSMDEAIDTIKQNIVDFVNGLSSWQLAPRLGLIDYGSADSMHYHKFNGSNFTTDPNEFIKALQTITTSGGTELPTIPLSYIATDGNYDWSTAPNTKRFAILVTDEGYDYDSYHKSSSLDDTIKKLQAAHISTTVVGNDTDGFFDYKPQHEKLVGATNGVYIDIHSNFGAALTNEITNWIVKTAEESRTYKIVTDHYQFFIKVTYERKQGSTLAATPLSSQTQTTPAAQPTSKEQTLPQTGEASSVLSTVLGSLLTALGLAGLKRKKLD